MLLFLAAGGLSWALAAILGAPMGWSEGWPFYGLWVVLFPFCWIAARTASFVTALRVSRHLGAAAEAAEAMRFGRAHRSLLAARIAAFIANAARAPFNLPRLAHSQSARLLERMGDWEGSLKASARLSRCSRRSEDKVVAYNGMLRALAMLDRMEGFAHVFGALEAIFEKEAGKYGAPTPAERGQDLSAFQPLAKTCPTPATGSGAPPRSIPKTWSPWRC
jgi:hypothetical protein